MQSIGFISCLHRCEAMLSGLGGGHAEVFSLRGREGWTGSKGSCHTHALGVNQKAVWDTGFISRKAQDFPPKVHIRLSNHGPCVEFQTLAQRQRLLVFMVGTQALVSQRVLFFSVPHNTQSNPHPRMCFIATVLMISVLSQNSNPDTLIILTANHYNNLQQKQERQPFGNLSEWSVTSGVLLLSKTCLLGINQWALFTALLCSVSLQAATTVLYGLLRFFSW